LFIGLILFNIGKNLPYFSKNQHSITTLLLSTALAAGCHSLACSPYWMYYSTLAPKVGFGCKTWFNKQYKCSRYIFVPQATQKHSNWQVV